MCGVCGWVSMDGRGIDEPWVRAATHALRHRGPDQEGSWIRESAALGFRRLAIMDPRPLANQPFVSESGQVALVCNGEIFNHVELRALLAGRGHCFRTQSDCEVCLHAYQEYGAGFVERLSGMFALAVIDLDRKKLLLARDRLGVKPLYYRIDARHVSFASELKALLLDPQFEPQIDPLALNLYTVQDAVPAPFTIYRGVHKLRPAELLEVDLGDAGSARCRTYWQLPTDEMPEPIDQDRLADELADTLARVVRAQSMSDVPIGVFLSAGLDSSTVLALLRQTTDREIVALTAAFTDRDRDESGPAAALARHFGVQHHVLTVETKALDDARSALSQFDEPFGDSSAIPSFAIAAAAREHVRVVLTGEGGDELFGGYLGPLDAAGHRWARRIPERIRTSLARFVPPLGALSRLSRFGLPDWALTASLHHPVTDPRRRTLLRPEWRRGTEEIVATYEPLRSRMESRPPLQGYFDSLLSRYLPDDLLTKVDRMTSAHGIEARVPLLDAEVVELAARIPANLKMSGRRTKPLLRKAMAGQLPTAALHGPKRGFGLPPSYLDARSLRHRLGAIADRCALVEEIVDLDHAASWDAATCWRGLALAVWIAHCHAPALDCGPS